jgi:hypothetical protein
MEFVAFKVKTEALATIVTCTQTPKVLTCFWHIAEQFKDNSLLLIPLLILDSNSNIKEDLRILNIKLWQLLKTLFYFCSCLFVVNPFLKEFLHGCLLRL